MRTIEQCFDVPSARSLPHWREFVELLTNHVPPEYADTCVVEIRGEDDSDDQATAYVTYVREETDQERTVRLAEREKCEAQARVAKEHTDWIRSLIAKRRAT